MLTTFGPYTHWRNPSLGVLAVASRRTLLVPFALMPLPAASPCLVLKRVVPEHSSHIGAGAVNLSFWERGDQTVFALCRVPVETEDGDTLPLW